jgi:multidrug efflux pump subunit AcrA (membrane-fusion protein)
MPLQNIAALRSEGLREFISHRPGFLIRWGIPIFFLLLTGLAIGSYFIQYPDIVKANARVNSINPPKQVIAKSGGRLIKLFKEDNKDIQQDDIIGYIESTASHDEVLRLSSILDTLQFFTDVNRLEEIPRFWKSTNQSFAHLGELQQSHQTFMQAYITFKDYLSTGFYVAKKQMLNRDISNTKKLLQILQQQKDLQQQDLANTIQNYNVHDTLHNETLITDIEYRNQKSQLINKKMSIPQVNSSIISNQGQQNALQKEMMELDNQIAQQKAVFIQVLNAYRNTVEDWKQKFLIMSPVSGKFVYAGFLNENQQLQAGQAIGFITNESNQYFVEMLIPQTNFGKVNPGLEVLLKFSSYPAQEFGSVKGRIDYIKSIPSDSGYLAKVSLPEGLVTNYKKNILFMEGLIAQAEIITEKRRLSDRFISGFKNLIK